MPAAPAAPPPSAPAAKPTATPAPAPKASPAPSATPSRPDPAVKEEPKATASYDAYLEEAGGEIDGLDNGAAKKPPAKVEPKKTEPVKPPEKKEEAKTEPVEEPKETPDQKPSGNPEDVIPNGIPELRKHAQTLAKLIKTEFRPKLAKAEARIAELEKNGDVSVWSKKAEEAEKRAAELDAQMKFVDYSKSDEFKTKFERPYAEAWSRAIADFHQLKVRVPAGIDEATGEPKFTFREANQNDLIKLGNLPLSEMDEAAETMFGKSAPRVIRHVEKVRELADAQQKALDDAQKNAGEHQKLTAAEQKRQSEEGIRIWKESHNELLTKYPKMFGPDEADPEGNAMLEKGTAEAERIFNRTAENMPKTAEEAARLHALAYQKIRNHDRLALRTKKQAARIAELEKALKEFEDSEPKGDRGGQPGSNGSSAWSLDAELAEIDKLDTR